MKGALNRVIIISVTLDTAYSGGVNCGWEKGGGGSGSSYVFPTS